MMNLWIVRHVWAHFAIRRFLDEQVRLPLEVQGQMKGLSSLQRYESQAFATGGG